MADELVNGSVTTVRPPSPQPTRRNLLSLETMNVKTGCIKLFVEIFTVGVAFTVMVVIALFELKQPATLVPDKL